MQPSKLRVGVYPKSVVLVDVTNCFYANRTRCSNADGTKTWGRGIDIEVFEATMKLLKWPYEYVVGHPYGSQDENGNWSGLIGMMANDEIDCSALSFRVDADRATAVDFSFPINYYQQTFVINQVMDKGDIRFILSPFQTTVWLYLAGILMLASFVHWLSLAALKLSKKEATRQLMGFPNCLWEMVGVLLKQYYSHYWFVSRIMLITFWSLFCLVTTTFYQSIMNSSLAVPLPSKVPFKNSLELIQLMEMGSYHLTYTQPGVEPQPPPSLTERFQQALVKNPIKIVTDVGDEVLNKKGVYFGIEDTQIAAYGVSRFGNAGVFAVVRDYTADTKWISFAFKKGFRDLGKFNSALIEILPGIGRIKARYKNVWGEIKEKAEAKTVRLSMQHLFDCFLMVMAGWVLAVIAYIGEVTYHRTHRGIVGWRKLLRDASFLQKRIVESQTVEE